LLRHPARLASSSLLRLQSDERLASLAVDGHEPAFAAIVDRYRTPLQRYCSGIVGPTRAEDAVQQTLISAHDALKRTTEVRHLRSWLYRIAHNASLNVLRSVRDDVPLDPSHAALADGPHAAFERTERLRETLTAVQELPERQRAALLLRELEGRSHEEIASALGVTTGSARQNLMRARAAVRGAVTAVTPYPLVAKLASGLASSPTATGWTDVAAGAGAGATIAKLTAGVMATGALVGGAVGTQQMMRPDHRSAPPAADAARKHRHAKPAAAAPVAAAAVADPATAVQHVTRQTGSSSTGAGNHSATSQGRDHQPASSGGGSPAGGGSGSGTGSGGSDDGHDNSTTNNSGRGHDTNRGDRSGDGSDGQRTNTSGSGDRSGSSSDGSGKRGSDDEQRSGSSKSVRDTSGDRPSSSGSGSDDEASHDAPAPTATAPATTPAPSRDERDDSRSSPRGSGPGTSASSTVPVPATVPSPPPDDGR
jgi:RNA polymerase sigma factor (sigma-70 family)